MKWLALLLTAAAVALAACNPDNIVPDRNYDWCYEFNFADADLMSRTYGYWGDGIGYYTDSNNNLGITYSHGTTVNPSVVEAGFRKAANGDISVRAVGNVFGVSVDIDEVIPALAPTGELYPYAIQSGGSAIGNEVNVTIVTNGGIVLQFLRVYGMFDNPFGKSNCEGYVVPSPGPATDTATPLPTSEYTSTPLVTNTPTDVPASTTPTASPTITPSHSATPTPTPTAHLFLGPVQAVPFSATAVTDPLYGPRSDAGIRFGYDPSGNSSIVGWWMWLDTTGSSSWVRIDDVATPNASSNNYTIPTNLTPPAVPAHGYSSSDGQSHSDYPGGFWAPSRNDGGAIVLPTVIAGFVTQQAADTVHQMSAVSSVSTPMPGQAAYSAWHWSLFGGTSGIAYGRSILYGWPTPTFTPSPTPTGTRTPTRTPGLPPITATAGATFTPRPGVSTVTPSRTPMPIVIPPTLPNYYVTATWPGDGTATPGPGTPTYDPSSTAEPGGTATGYPAMTGTPVMLPGEVGDLTGLGGGILSGVNNLLNFGFGWIGSLTSAFNRVVNAWYVTPAMAPPGVPLCASQPRTNEFCAILYIIRYTILSGPVGGLIMPLATIVFDLFIVFLFIRMARAILARLSKITEV